MLDAYIIDRMRRDQEERENKRSWGYQIPLPQPEDPEGSESRKDPNREERGVVQVDYHV